MEEEKLNETDLIKKYTKEMGFNPFKSKKAQALMEKRMKDKQKRRAKNKAARKARRK